MFNKSTCATFNTSWPPWPSLTWPPCTLCSRPEFCLPHWWDLSHSLSSKVQPYLRHCPPPSLLAPAKTFEVFARQGNTFAFHLTCPNGPLKYIMAEQQRFFSCTPSLVPLIIYLVEAHSLQLTYQAENELSLPVLPSLSAMISEEKVSGKREKN